MDDERAGTTSCMATSVDSALSPWVLWSQYMVGCRASPTLSPPTLLDSWAVWRVYASPFSQDHLVFRWLSGLFVDAVPYVKYGAAVVLQPSV